MRTLIATALVCFVAASAIAQSSCRSTILVTALDQKSHRVIDGLTMSDFRATSKGRELPMVAAVPASIPRRLVMVVDRSGSMTLSHEESLAPERDPRVLVPLVVRDVLSALPAGKSSVALLMFDGSGSYGTGFSSPADALQGFQDAIAPKTDAKRRSVRTPLWDAIESALRMLTPHQPGDLIFVISDGADNASRVWPDKVRDELVRTGVPLWTSVVSGPGPKSEDAEQGLRNLLRLARETGGIGTVHGTMKVSPEVNSALHERPYELISLLQHQYELTIETPPLEKMQKWELRIPPASKERSHGVDLFYPRLLGSCQTTR